MDHKLKIFREVALTKSFTKAAENLFISQPAVSKTIKNLEQTYGKAFFLRKGNHITLTSDGKKFLEYSEQILHLYTTLSNDFSTSDTPLEKHLKIAASTTIGQYVIPRIAARIPQFEHSVQLELLCGNTGDVQQQILNGQYDFGFVEGENHDSRLQYEPFVKDELVLLTNFNNPFCKVDSLSLTELEALPFVFRENGSGSKEVILSALKKQSEVHLEAQIVLGSTESIKSYLKHSNHFAFLSIHAIQQELIHQQLRVIEVDGLTIERWFYFVSRQGYQSKNYQKIKQLFLNGYNQK